MSQSNSITTDFTRLLGIRYPIISAPMFLLSNPDMLVAVAEAGGLGIMPALNLRSTESFEEAVREIRGRTNKPFGINMIVLGNDRLEADMDVCVKHKVPFIVTSLGNPTDVIRRTHEYGGRVFCDVINLKHALKVKSAGADGLITVAAGAGGHAGPIAMNVLVPWLKKETGMPVIAAGGIGSGAQVLSALALGASAAYLGTRFIATRECPAEAGYKDMILSASPEDIVMSPVVTGHDCNFLKDSLARFSSGESGLKRWKDVWSAGQGVGLINDIPSIQELVDRLVAEYVEELERVKKTLG